VLKHLVRRRPVRQPKPVRGEGIDTERVVIAQQREDLAGPAPYVRLPHPQLDLLLSKIVSIGNGSAIPPYTPISEIVPPRRTISIAR
jgi:hypothetical protein